MILNLEATACRKSLSVYVCLVNVAFVAAGLSVLPQRHTLLDMILSALRECCMLMAILIYMAMPLPTVLGHSNRKDRCSWTLAAIFPALLAMLVFPVVRHDAICAGNLHCYLFGLCKVAMILSYQCLGRIWRSPVWISCWPAVNQPCKLCKSPPFICLKGSVFFLNLHGIHCCGGNREDPRHVHVLWG